MSSIREAGELSVIEAITSRLPKRDDILVGAGDDCSVLRLDSGNTDLLLTSDPVIEGIHFDKDANPSDVGHKAIGRALSDIAAMAGEPGWALVNIVAPPQTATDLIDEIYSGALSLANTFKLAIVGGDISEGSCLEIHVFATGSIPHQEATLRSGAKPGEILFATGTLGGSRTRKHLEFTPRIKEGIWLRSHATSMIDISDGLATDLRHLVNSSNTGALIASNTIPVSTAASNANDGIPPIEHALYDGEDFELLFTVSNDEKKSFLAKWSQNFDLPCTEIGVITDKAGIIETTSPDGQTAELTGEGYEHFKTGTKQ